MGAGEGGGASCSGKKSEKEAKNIGRHFLPNSVCVSACRSLVWNNPSTPLKRACLMLYAPSFLPHLPHNSTRTIVSKSAQVWLQASGSYAAATAAQCHSHTLQSPIHH